MNYFDFQYRVRYADTDKLGISYYSNYLVWFEAARTEYFRALGLPYTECEKKGYFLPVAEASVKYHAPSTYDDLIVIRTSVSEIRRTSMRFEYRACNEQSGRLLATGFTVHVFVDAAMKPVRVPAEVSGVVSVHSVLEA